MEEKIGILGSGGWGICLSILLSKKNNKITLWEPIKENYEILIKERENKVYFPEVKIPENVFITNSIEETLKNSENLIITVRSTFFKETIETIEKHYSGQKVLVGTKGMEVKTKKFFSEIIEEKKFIKNYGIISGPTIAREIILGFPTAAVIASNCNALSLYLQKLLSSDIFRVYITKDIKGVQVGGSFKNVIAIGAGIVDGLQLGMNTKASYLTRGLNEMIKVGRKLGGKEKTLRGLSGIGDLITTSFSKYSRNRSFGEGIIREGKENYLEKTKMVIEGIYATDVYYTLSHRLKVELPITSSIYRIIFSNSSPIEEINYLMKRKLKRE